jgi:hypothetical protein
MKITDNPVQAVARIRLRALKPVAFQLSSRQRGIMILTPSRRVNMNRHILFYAPSIPPVFFIRALSLPPPRPPRKSRRRRFSWRSNKFQAFLNLTKLALCLFSRYLSLNVCRNKV